MIKFLIAMVFAAVPALVIGLLLSLASPVFGAIAGCCVFGLGMDVLLNGRVE